MFKRELIHSNTINDVPKRLLFSNFTGEEKFRERYKHAKEVCIKNDISYAVDKQAYGMTRMFVIYCNDDTWNEVKAELGYI